ncbi:MAG TPA: response regulator [Candidatus Peribacteraceae bacterium]|nr:response regulator [Candidatus Peribacteraceae bacterium]
MPAKPQSADKEKSEAKPGRGGKKILIVEDERPLAHALELKFQHEGFDTTVCVNGKDALEEALKNKYDMILLDLIMPQMDGFTFMEELKSRKKNYKIIILSNLGQDEDRMRSKELGAIDYFVKSNTPITDIIKRVKISL